MEVIRTSVQTITIDHDQVGRRLDHFLFSLFQNIPKSRIYRIIRKGEVRINRKRTQPEYHLKIGDIVRLPPMVLNERDRSLIKIPQTVLEQLSQSILYEDDQLIILNKPAGLAVHGGSDVPFGVIEGLRALKADYPFLELVHRLDKETSGCLIIAKRGDVLRAVQDLFRKGKVKKTYCALTLGHWLQKNNWINVALLRKNVLRSGERKIQVAEDEEGKKAVTYFRVIENFANSSLVKIDLKTGRMHQIRVHAEWAGHPIAGDKKYGSRDFNKAMQAKGLHRLFLHAQSIEFQLTPSKKINVSAPLEKRLISVLENLKKNK